jgi:vesicle-fusing ATPase
VSMIILDDLERILEFVSLGLRFSNVVLQNLLVLVKALPPPGHRLFIVGTTGQPAALEPMELMGAFQLQLAVPEIEQREEFAAVLKDSGLFSAGDIATIASHLHGKPMGIKKLLNIIEMSRTAGVEADESGAQAQADAVTSEMFMESLVEWGM